jgi:hypothetical protein
MSNDQQPKLSTLPVELIFQIFRHLDAKTIVRSCRRVCQRFYTLVKVYDEFQLDFQSIFKSDFHFLCNFVPNDHVTSLVLADDDETPGQIGYFLSTFRIDQFTRLRSLTFLSIDEHNLQLALKNVNKLNLQSLSIQIKEDRSFSFIDNSEQMASNLALASCHLHKLRLDISHFRLSSLNWPLDCTLHHLETRCVTLNDFCHIFLHLPNLRVLVVENFNESDAELTTLQISTVQPCCRLTSLTFKYGRMSPFILEVLLSLAPSLEHLRLMRSVDVYPLIAHLPRWEQFITTKLPLLTKFEFFLMENARFSNNVIDTEVIIAPFRTSFWTETKRWFTTCDYMLEPRTVLLYTPPIFDPHMEYAYESKRIDRSSSAPTDSKITVMDKVHRISLDLSRVMSLATSSHVCLPTCLESRR